MKIKSIAVLLILAVTAFLGGCIDKPQPMSPDQEMMYKRILAMPAGTLLYSRTRDNAGFRILAVIDKQDRDGVHSHHPSGEEIPSVQAREVMKDVVKIVEPEDPCYKDRLTEFAINMLNLSKEIRLSQCSNEL